MTRSAGSTIRPGYRRAEQTASPAGARKVAAAVALLAASALMALILVPVSGTAARAAVPGPGQTRTGRATHYSLGSSGVGGNCSFPGEKLSDHLYVAAGPEDYADAGGCGAYLDVTGPSGRVRVMIADKCPECESGHLDLSEEAFARIGQLAAGIIPISYRTVRDPTLPGPLEVRVKEGSSQWWIAFLIMNHGNPLTSVEYRESSGAWRALVRQPYNYWLKSDGAGPGPFTLRITDTVGHQVTVGNVALSPLVTQRTSVSMYGSSAGTAPTTTPATPTARPTQTVNPTPSATRTVTTSPASTGTPTSGTGTPTTCRATVAIAAQWSGGYLATVSVLNSGTARNPWQVSWTMPAGATLVNGWNATVIQRGRQVTATAPAWNRNLPTGGSIAVGFVVNGPSSSLPDAVRLAGTACRA